MECEVFTAGVEPGAPTTDNEIKMLLCYVLDHAEDPVAFAQLNEGLQSSGLVNYFELVETLGELSALGHIVVSEGKYGEELYQIAPSGRDMAKAFTSNIPYTVKEKAVRECKKALKRRKRASEVTVKIQRVDDGFKVTLGIPDATGTDFIKLSLFLPNERQCAVVKQKFLNDPEFIYKSIMSLLMGDSHVVGSLMPNPEKLFD
ncbi:DUF4364 family protein [Oscillospiraceae bacterium MB08-C2-2]|nr:DUF4364 family protein [Oscillospiraceae bacterium MB08-C2-2]